MNCVTVVDRQGMVWVDGNKDDTFRMTRYRLIRTIFTEYLYYAQNGQMTWARKKQLHDMGSTKKVTHDMG